MQHLAAKGWVCVAINYRLAPRDPFPAQIVDVKRAIAWIREHIARVRRRPRLHRDHRRLGRRAPDRAGRRHPERPDYQPGFEDADTSVAGRRAPLRRLRLRRLDRACAAAEQMRDKFLAPRGRRSSAGPRTPRSSRPALPCCGSPGRPRLLRPARRPRHARRGRPGPPVRRTGSARSPSATVVYAELPGAQHAFDVFPSIRSAHVVRAIDRYLHWHWNSWRRQQALRRSSEPRGTPSRWLRKARYAVPAVEEGAWRLSRNPAACPRPARRSSTPPPVPGLGLEKSEEI